MNRGGRGGRGSSRGRGRGGTLSRGQPQKQSTPDSIPMDLVRPILPPLYPEYAEGVYLNILDSVIGSQVPELAHFKNFFRSNYIVKEERKKTAFEVDKYTDNYDDPFQMDPKLQYFLDNQFLPKELYAKGTKASRMNRQRKIDEEQILRNLIIKEKNDDTVSSDSENETKNPRKRPLEHFDSPVEVKKEKPWDPETGEIEDEDIDEEDEEMDEGNDYMNDYFDNGEEFLSDDEALEDGNVF